MSDLPRCKEPSHRLIHYIGPPGLDQATLCGITDWLAISGIKPHPDDGKPTRAAATCRHCIAIVEYCRGPKP